MAPHKQLLSWNFMVLTVIFIGGFLKNKNRLQSVLVEGYSSKAAKVLSGVPQGTLLGPLLFLLHINDCPHKVLSTVCMFADDCLLYRPILDISDQINLQKDMDAPIKWSALWGMRLNASSQERRKKSARLVLLFKVMRGHII